MKWTVIGNKYFAKLFVLDHGASTWFNPIYQVPLAKLCSGQIRLFTNSPFVTFNCSIPEIPHEIFFCFFFLKNFRPFKNMESLYLQVLINTVILHPFNFWCCYFTCNRWYERKLLILPLTKSCCYRILSSEIKLAKFKFFSVSQIFWWMLEKIFEGIYHALIEDKVGDSSKIKNDEKWYIISA